MREQLVCTKRFRQIVVRPQVQSTNLVIRLPSRTHNDDARHHPCCQALQDLPAIDEGQTDVEHEVGTRLDFGHLRCALEDLTPIQRRTLELFYFEGLELREISERLREPFGNVRHHFYRGLERLRKSPVVKRLRDNHNA